MKFIYAFTTLIFTTSSFAQETEGDGVMRLTPTQEKKTLPTTADKETDADSPNFGSWLRGMMDMPYENLAASSSLKSSSTTTYGVENLSDDNPQTAWVEGKDDYGIGESIEFCCGSLSLVIYNGYQKSQTAYSDNSRVKTLKVYFDDTFAGYLALNDAPNAQRFELAEFGVEEFDKIRLEIDEVYPGKKWKDTAISELFFIGG
jgi:hypothetical protein